MYRIVAASQAPTTPRQTVLPFGELVNPQDVAVDSNDNVYGTDTRKILVDNGFDDFDTNVIGLAAGTDTRTVLPQRVHTVLMPDSTGAVWVQDAGNDHLVKLGSDPESTLPLPDLGMHGTVLAVDAAGSVYVADSDRDRVLKLATGADTPTVVPFTGLDNPIRVTVDATGNVYVVDGGNRRVLKLAVEVS